MSERVRGRGRNRMPAEQRREQILAAASTMIAERGFWATSLREVADACGITVAGVLHHFRSKEALLGAVIEHQDLLQAQEVGQRLGGDLIGGDTGDLTLARVCRDLVAHNAGRREIVRLYTVLAAEALDAEHPAHDYFRERQEHALARLAQLAPPGYDAMAVATQVMALLDGLQIQWLRDPSRDWAQDWERATAGLPWLSDPA